MWVLAFETCSEIGELALVRLGTEQLVLERHTTIPETHHEQLSVLLQSALQEADISAQQICAIVVGAGPGSFTGLRIGFGFAKGLAHALRVPLSGYSSFEGAALAVSAAANRFVVLADARRGEYFAQEFRARVDCAPEQLSAIDILSAEELKRRYSDESGAELFMLGRAADLPGRGGVRSVSHIARGLARRWILDQPPLGWQGVAALGEIAPTYVRKVSAKTIAERSIVGHQTG